METVVHASSLRPRVEVASRTDPGRDPDKQVNEDAYAYRATPFGHLLVVCDGMGGHTAGEEASHLALQTIIETVESAPLDTPARAVLAHAVRTANERVYGLAGPDAIGRPGSTIVLALVQSSGAVVAHVGDSRCYLVRHGQALALTRDHSVVQQMVDQGMITADQAVGHPDANRILRALGVTPAVDVEVRSDAVPFVASDAFLLCSDGLTDLVNGSEIAQVVQEAGNVERAAIRLVDLANERGGHDNITVLIARVIDDATAQAAPTVVGTQPDHERHTPPGSGATLVGTPLAGGGYPHGPHAQPPPSPPPHHLHPQSPGHHPHATVPGAPMGAPMQATPPGPMTPGAPMQAIPAGGITRPHPSGATLPGTPARTIPDAPYSQPSIPPSLPRRSSGSGRGVLVAGVVLVVLAVVVVASIGVLIGAGRLNPRRTPAFVDAGTSGARDAAPPIIDNAVIGVDASAPIPDVIPTNETSPLPSLVPTPSASAEGKALPGIHKKKKPDL